MQQMMFPGTSDKRFFGAEIDIMGEQDMAAFVFLDPQVIQMLNGLTGTSFSFLENAEFCFHL